MITDETTQVIQPEEFRWTLTNEKDLFQQPQVMYNYQPYSFKFMEHTFPKMIRIRRFVYLDILLGNTQLLDAAHVVDYHINVNHIENIREELLRIGQDAHDRFMVLLEERRSQSCISPTYQPTFDLSVFQTKIDLGLKTGGAI